MSIFNIKNIFFWTHWIFFFFFFFNRSGSSFLFTWHINYKKYDCVLSNVEHWFLEKFCHFVPFDKINSPEAKLVYLSHPYCTTVLRMLIIQLLYLDFWLSSQLLNLVPFLLQPR